MDTSKEKEFQKRLFATFKVEAEEHVEALTLGILNLEKAKDAKQLMEIVEVIFREAHSLKGAARAVNLDQIENICKSLENIFLLIKQGKFQLQGKHFDTLHQSLDFINQILANIEESEEDLNNEEFFILLDEMEAIASREIDVEAAFENIEGQKETKQQEEKSEAPDFDVPADLSSEIHAAKDTIRIPVSKLDTIMRQAEEMISLKLKLAQHQHDFKLEKLQIGSLRKNILKEEMDAKKIQAALYRKKTTKPGFRESPDKSSYKFLPDEFYTDVYKVEQNLSRTVEAFDTSLREADLQVNQLLNSVRETLMMPCSHLTELLPKLVRDLSRDQGKEVVLNISGDDYELDRRIIEHLRDPIIHIIRNSIDHGLETEEERKIRGKNKTGLIEVKVIPVGGNKVEISISDDGNGFDLEAIRSEIGKSEDISTGELKQLTKGDLIYSVFESGLSTRKLISDISGHGLGMAIVKEQIDLLGGRVEIESTKGKGSTISLIIPHTFGNFRGVSILAGGQEFIFPNRNIENLIHIDYSQISTIEGREIIKYNKENLPFFSLGSILGLTETVDEKEQHKIALILHAGSRRIAVSVDALIQEQEILIKSFPAPLKRVRHFEGATILGSGKVVLIVSVQDIINDFNQGLLSGTKKFRESKSKEKAKRILIAEDSMTARMLLKDILESSGFEVRTAVDGGEALAMIKTEKPDLLVSDVEMPVMNGFDLTAAIRENDLFADLPVVLVTALKTKKDRERGLELGANAYIEKAKFDPQNLLDIINKLI